MARTLDGDDRFITKATKTALRKGRLIVQMSGRWIAPKFPNRIREEGVTQIHPLRFQQIVEERRQFAQPQTVVCLSN